MDPLRNPFSPGAGAPPPELAGRGEIIDSAEISLGRVIRGRSAQSQILLGLRGVGKTVLLNQVETRAKAQGYVTSFIEAPEDKALAELLYPRLRQTLRKLSSIEAAKTAARAALGALRSFASAFKIAVGDVEIGVEGAPGTADSGDIATDLAEMFELVGRAAQAAGSGWALLIDEVQYLSEEELGAIIVAVHRMNQLGLPILVFAAGLPQIAKLSGDAKSYAERLFAYPAVGALDRRSAFDALRNPVLSEKARIETAALDIIFDRTGGYPFFLQEWGYHAWDLAQDGLIRANDAEMAGRRALARLDAGFFKVRMDRLTPAEVEYVDAMAQLGDGPYKSADVAQHMGRKPASLGPCRAKIIEKGMIFSPGHGEIDFTVPLFADFVRRRG